MYDVQQGFTIIDYSAGNGSVSSAAMQFRNFIDQTLCKLIKTSATAEESNVWHAIALKALGVFAGRFSEASEQFVYLRAEIEAAWRTESLK